MATLNTRLTNTDTETPPNLTAVSRPHRKTRCGPSPSGGGQTHELSAFGLSRRFCPKPASSTASGPTGHPPVLLLQNFRPSLSFANSLTDLATLYDAHEQLMAHWMRTLPVPIHQIQYEELVTAPEANIRALLDFCGLEWDEQCLSPEQSSAYRNTASYAQVRQAIHTRSIGRWKHYRTHLEPLISRLNLSETE